jgi:hypothetical protein
VRQGIDAGDGKGEVRVVLVGQPEAVGLDAEPEQAGVAVERLFLGGDGQAGELLGGEDGVMGQTSLQATADELEGITERHEGEHFHRLR